MMIRQLLDLYDWDWRVYVYYVVDECDVDEILHKMRTIGASEGELIKASLTLSADVLNCGITYSNIDSRRSVVVIGQADSAEEFASTYDHEKGHLAMHIAEALGLSIYGEEFQYLTGEIGRQMFRVAKQFMCECCRERK